MSAPRDAGPSEAMPDEAMALGVVVSGVLVLGGSEGLHVAWLVVVGVAGVVALMRRSDGRSDGRSDDEAPTTDGP
jgi:hypothetical protein